ncbi:MAG: hypothetical protein JWP69_1711 [Flaviaesturariibacter sp.]|nr:hypothetical protein [Flaviaesturariibacter sp.]
MKYFLTIILSIFLSHSPCIKLNIINNKKNNKEVFLKVINCGKKKLYYTIGLEAKENGKWSQIVSDINSLGKNTFLYYKPLSVNKTDMANLNLEKMPSQYEGKIVSLRLVLMYRTDINKVGKVKFYEIGSRQL